MARVTLLVLRRSRADLMPITLIGIVYVANANHVLMYNARAHMCELQLAGRVVVTVDATVGGKPKFETSRSDEKRRGSHDGTRDARMLFGRDAILMEYANVIWMGTRDVRSNIETSKIITCAANLSIQ